MSSLRTGRLRTGRLRTGRSIRLRLLALGLALLGAVFITAGYAPAASAAPAKPTITVPVEGTTAAGESVTGEYRITRFVERNGDLFAKGTFVGEIASAGEDSKVRKAVTVPVTVTSGAAADSASDSDLTAQQVTCDILNLELGPLDLNLLGLRVQLNQVNLDITAEQAPGNLLGNLLCAVAHLLDGPPSLNAIIAQLLNAILGILG